MTLTKLCRSGWKFLGLPPCPPLSLPPFLLSLSAGTVVYVAYILWNSNNKSDYFKFPFFSSVMELLDFGRSLNMIIPFE